MAAPNEQLYRQSTIVVPTIASSRANEANIIEPDNSRQQLTRREQEKKK